MRDRLVGIIAMVRPQADLDAGSRHASTSVTIPEVQRNPQLCSASLRSLTGDPTGCNQRGNDDGGQSSRSGAKARSVGRVSKAERRRRRRLFRPYLKVQVEGSAETSVSV